MESQPLEVIAIDYFNAHKFLLYFSDQTFATVSSQALAECFPERQPIDTVDEEDE